MKNASLLAWRLFRIAFFQAQNISTPPLRLTLAATLGASIALSAVSFAATKVAVKLQGDIAPECALTGSLASSAVSALGATIDLPDITTPGRTQYNFTVDCNAPFDYRLEAKYGALTNVDGVVALTQGFTHSVPYDVAIYIPTDGGAIDDRCSGASIGFGKAACRFSNSGNRIALASRGNLVVAWAAPDGIPIAGQYVDKLTLTVGVRQ